MYAKRSGDKNKINKIKSVKLNEMYFVFKIKIFVYENDNK